MQGICALCQQHRELQQSHLLAAALFKAVVQGYAPYDTAPVWADMTTGAVLHSNFQPRKHLLCFDCEQRFSKCGEEPVIAACHRKDGEFKARDELKQASPSLARNGKRIYFGDQLPVSFNAMAYSYFLLSVLWRASVTDWGGAYSQYRLALGARYEELFRLFLLGRREFPENTVVSVYVDFDENPNTLLAPPTHAKTALRGIRFHEHGLVIPGMRLIAMIGGNVAKLQVPAASGYPTFFEWRMAGTPFERRIAADMRSLQPKGKLARQS